MEKPMVTKQGILDAQVCVPKDWTDKQALNLLEKDWPCGTTNGWQMRKNGDEDLGGDPERQPCAERKDFVHIMFDA